MKTAMLVATILALLILSHFYNPNIQGQMACGQGVVMRSNGIVVIDGWTGYDTSTPPPPPVGPPVGLGAGGQVKTISYPTQITFGMSAPSIAKVCVETENGSQCKSLADIRGFISKVK